MTEASEETIKMVSLRCEQRSYPAYHAFHGTNSPMLWRRLTVETPFGSAAFEQTDYGHPGRLNQWEPRGIPVALVPKNAELRNLAAAVSALLD